MKFWTFLKISIFWKFWNFITPLPIIINIYWTPSLPMVFWPPLPMVYRPPTHGILTPLPMVYRPPYPWYFNPPAHGISTSLPMVYQTLSYGIMNSYLLVEMRGASIYHEGVQNTMTKNWPRGQNTIWKIEPGVKIS